MPTFGEGEGDSSVYEGNGSKNPWELHKENIQPLSHGRKISLLNQSLSNAGHGGDQEVAGSLANLEDDITKYTGNDPLGVWIRCIMFYEQNCLTTGKYQAKYDELLKNCVKKFINQDQWKNDKRFVEILLKSFSKFAPEKRINILNTCLMNQGVGVHSSTMYTQMAEDFEALKKYEKASEILEMGKKNNAQPMEYLDEFITNFQVRVAERVCQQLKKGEEGHAVQDSRLFGSSVPIVGPQHEAQNIRDGLFSADPSRARPALPGNANEPRKVTIYQQNENQNSHPSSKTTAESAAEIERNMNIAPDKENFIEPSKWSKPEAVLTFNPPPAIATAPPVEKIQIFVDNENSVVEAAPRKPRKTLRPVLSERKLEPEPCQPEDEKQLKFQVVVAPTEEVKTISPPNATAASAVTNEGFKIPETPVQSGNIISGLALPPPPPEPMPPLPANQRIMCRLEDLWQDGKELTFEHLRVAEYMKRKIVAQDLLAQTKKAVQVTVGKVLNAVATSRDTQLEKENEELKKENANLKRRISDLETRLVELEIKTQQNKNIEGQRVEKLVLETLKKQQISSSNLQSSKNQTQPAVADFTEPVFVAPKSVTRPVYGYNDTFHNNKVAPPPPEPECDDTEVILARRANYQPELDLSNLTRALNLNPNPIHNSTPERIPPPRDGIDGRTFQVKPIPLADMVDGDCGDGSEQQQQQPPSNPVYTAVKANFNATMQIGHNLSTIQENSKESRASNTTSSSGSTANYTKSAHKTVGRSQLVTSAAHSQYQYTNPADWTNN